MKANSSHYPVVENAEKIIEVETTASSVEPCDQLISTHPIDPILMHELATLDGKTPDELAIEINCLHRDVELEFDKIITAINFAREFAFRAGARLIAAKKLLPHGQFELWAKKHFGHISHATRSRYMDVARNISYVRSLDPQMGLRKIYQALARRRQGETLVGDGESPTVKSLRHCAEAFDRIVEKFESIYIGPDELFRFEQSLLKLEQGLSTARRALARQKRNSRGRLPAGNSNTISAYSRSLDLALAAF